MSQQIELFGPDQVAERLTLADVYKQIQEVYLKYPYPWVIGYNGGKDSTATLQLIWYALAELPREQLQKRNYSPDS
jgi:DNA sulfur modification protein DndC